MKGFLHYYSLEKYVEFFVRIHAIPRDQREKFVKELEEDYELRERIIPVILMIVERVSEMDKIRAIANIVNARTLYKIDNDTFFRMLHIVEQVSWPDLYLIYLEHCYHDELDTKDRELSIGRYHGDMTKVLTQNIGLYNINRKIRDEENSNSYGQKKEIIIKEDKKLTSLGTLFLIFAFKASSIRRGN